MIDATYATVILAAFLIIFGIVIPVMDSTKFFKRFISFRWVVVVVILALMISVVIDFKDLPDESRKILLMGGLIIAGGYVFLRTCEKLFARGYIGKKPVKLEVKKGDVSASAQIGGEEDGRK